MDLPARPYPFSFAPAACALLVIDMQRDFLEAGGFGEALGNDVALLRVAVGPTRTILEAARSASLLIVHTREGMLPT